MRVATTALSALMLTLAPGAALAAGGTPPGVHVDPGSPSQHQYVLPLNAARAETSGGSHGGGGGSGSHLFGNGVTAASANATGTGAGKGAKGRANGRKPGSKGLHPSYSLASSGRPPSGPGSAGGGDGGSGWVPLVAGGALVLLLGCGGGLLLRRRILGA